MKFFTFFDLNLHSRHSFHNNIASTDIDNTKPHCMFSGCFASIPSLFNIHVLLNFRRLRCQLHHHQRLPTCPSKAKQAWKTGRDPLLKMILRHQQRDKP
jgi:hypothetical protein